MVLKGKMLRYMTVMLSCLFVFFAGCGSKSAGVSEDASMTEAPAAAEESDIYMAETSEEITEEAPEEAGESNVPSASSQRKLIKTVSLQVETQNCDELLTKVEDNIKFLGGYIENMESYKGNDSGKYADMTIRVPKEKMDEFITAVADQSNIIRRSESTEDITLKYVDSQSRKKALQTEYDRLIALLEKSGTMEEIITVENRLSEVRYELENLESQLRTFDNLVDYATVHLQITEVSRITPVETLSFGDKVSAGFMNSLYNVGGGFRSFALAILVNLPYLLLWGLFLFAVVFVPIKIIKTKQKKREAYVNRVAQNQVNQQPQQTQYVDYTNENKEDS